MDKTKCIASAVLITASVACEDMIPALSSVTGGPSVFTWDYTASLTADEKIVPGTTAPGVSVPPTDLTVDDFFTVYDFAGLVPGTCVAPTGWVCQTQLVGSTPTDTSPADNISVTNLTFYYTGSSTLTGAKT